MFGVEWLSESMEYIKVFMKYESMDMPVVYFYEVNVDDERLARRAIEVFENRRLSKMADLYRDVMEVLPIPTADELNAGIWGEGFYAFVISKEEFEMVWESGVYSGVLSII